MSFLAGLVGVSLIYAAITAQKDGSMPPACWASFGAGCLLVVVSAVMWWGDR